MFIMADAMILLATVLTTAGLGALMRWAGRRWPLQPNERHFGDW
jgi:hypothetical protein